jgi:hypothetical protein
MHHWCHHCNEEVVVATQLVQTDHQSTKGITNHSTNECIKCDINHPFQRMEREAMNWLPQKGKSGWIFVQNIILTYHHYSIRSLHYVITVHAIIFRLPLVSIDLCSLTPRRLFSYGNQHVHDICTYTCLHISIYWKCRL